MSLEDWMPNKAANERCFFGTDISAEEKRGWNEGRESLKVWYSKLTLWERIKMAFRGRLSFY